MKRDFYGVSEFIKENGGVENFRCFAQMRRIEMVIPFMGISVVSDSNMTWMECKIDERHYKVEDGYKITLVPLQEGFAKEDLPHLFERFYRGEKEKNNGIGIGLSLSKAIIEMQNGIIRAFNLPNGGPRFEVRFYAS